MLKPRMVSTVRERRFGRFRAFWSGATAIRSYTGSCDDAAWRPRLRPYCPTHLQSGEQLPG
eukprot:4276141-Lingulodinium_polyedra.AAC.1